MSEIEFLGQFDCDLARHWQTEHLVEYLYLLDNENSKPQKTDNGITDDMVDAARDYPITGVLDFSRGVAMAFCHDDHRPSLVHLTRTNRAWCPVCDKKYDAIAVLMERDGMTFIDAVKELA